MKTRILGAIGMIWGGGIIVYGLLSALESGRSPYESGGIGGLLFGVVFFAVGLYYFLKKEKL